MANKSQDARARADVRLQRRESAEREGAKARAAYDAEVEATRAKTAKLKALRLAREAAEQKAAPSEPAAPKRVKGGAKTKGGAKKDKPAPLSDWLKGQGADGRRS